MVRTSGDVSTPGGAESIRLAEVIAILSLAIDLGMGTPLPGSASTGSSTP